MAVSPQKKVTYEEWLTFPDEPRTELIDGEVCVAAEPTLRHQRLLGRLYVEIDAYLRARGGGEAFLTPNLRLSVYQGYAPDLVFVRDAGDDPLSIRGAPALVVEIVSDARRDLLIKRDRYEEHGVPEYWAILPDADRVEVYRLNGGVYGKPAILEPPDRLTSPVLPGLDIDLSALFAR